MDLLFLDTHKVLLEELIYELITVVGVLGTSIFLVKWRTPFLPTVWHLPQQ